MCGNTTRFGFNAKAEPDLGLKGKGRGGLFECVHLKKYFFCGGVIRDFLYSWIPKYTTEELSS